MDKSTKDILKVAAISLAAYAVAMMVQSRVQIPLVGMYLPGGR